MAKGKLINKSAFSYQGPTPESVGMNDGGFNFGGAALGAAAGFGVLGMAVGGGLFGRKKSKGPTNAEIERDRLMAQYKTQEFQYTNPYEDMTVNLQAAQMQQQGLAQNQANILEQLRGGTSGAGAAALATGLARQAAKSQREISVDIGQQEQNIQLQQAQSEAEGQQLKQQFEFDRMQTLLGMSMEEVAAEKQAALAKQQQKSDTFGQIIGAVGSLAGVAMMASDRDLKKNIKKVGKSPSGINVYEFEYKDKSDGEGVYQGVMSDDLPKEIKNKAVTTKNGIDAVDYSVLDVEFKRIK